MIYSNKTGSAINEYAGLSGFGANELEKAGNKYTNKELEHIKDADAGKTGTKKLLDDYTYDSIKPEVNNSKDFSADPTIVKKAKADETEAQKNKSIFRINESAYSQLDLSGIERTPEFNEMIYEYMDLEDNTTRKVLFAMNEAEQDRMGISLTSRLYETIIDRIDDIDFGEIPRTRGDITKLPNYGSLKDCIQLMTEVLKHYNEGSSQITTLVKAMNNIESRTKSWVRAYSLNIEFPMVIYNTIVLALIQSTTYMLSMCIDFIKSPTADKFDIVVDRGALNKSKDHMVFESLEKFNAACDKGAVDKCIEACLRENVKNFSGSLVALAPIGAIVAILAIIPCIKELVFLYYYSRVKVSDYFEAQSNILELNAYNIESGNGLVKTGQDAKKVAEKQVAVAAKFRTISEKIAVDNKSAERQASNALVSERKKLKADDVVSTAPDAITSALF